jgi:extradiol dioxygenase family protein
MSWQGAVMVACVLSVALGAVLGMVRAAPAGKAPRLFRVIVPVDEIERAAKFYTELLGVAGQRVSPGRHYFDCGGVVVALYDPKADGDTEPARPLPEPLYFAVADLEAVFARAERLGGLSPAVVPDVGAMGKIETRPWGERSFYMQDPFGNPLCFTDEKTVFTGP